MLLIHKALIDLSKQGRIYGVVHVPGGTLLPPEEIQLSAPAFKIKMNEKNYITDKKGRVKYVRKVIKRKVQKSNFPIGNLRR